MRTYQGFKMGLYVDSRAMWFGVRITHLESGRNRLFDEWWHRNREGIEGLLDWISEVLIARTPRTKPRWLQAWEILSGLFPDHQEVLDAYLAGRLAGAMMDVVRDLE